MRGRLFVISEAGSDGTNTSQTATYKCLVSDCVSLPGSSPVTTLLTSPPDNFKLHKMAGFSPGRCQSECLKAISRGLMQARASQFLSTGG